MSVSLKLDHCTALTPRRLAKLAHFYGLFRYLRGLIAAIDRRREMWDSKTLFEHAYVALEQILFHCRRAFLEIAKKIFNDSPWVSEIASELFLTRLYHQLKDFLKCRQSIPLREDDVGDYKHIGHVLREVIQTRTWQYRRTGEHTEADLLLLEVASLRDWYGCVSTLQIDHSDESEAFRKQSDSLNTAYQQFEVELKYQACLELNDSIRNIVPATHLASAAGRSQVVWKIIIDKTQPDDARDLLGRRTIHLAVEGEHLDLMKLLLEQNPDARSSRDVFHMTPASLAILRGDVTALQSVVRSRDDLIVTHRDCGTLVGMVAMMGHDERFRFVFQRYNVPFGLHSGAGEDIGEDYPSSPDTVVPESHPPWRDTDAEMGM